MPNSGVPSTGFAFVSDVLKQVTRILLRRMTLVNAQAERNGESLVSVHECVSTGMGRWNREPERKAPLMYVAVFWLR